MQRDISTFSNDDIWKKVNIIITLKDKPQNLWWKNRAGWGGERKEERKTFNNHVIIPLLCLSKQRKPEMHATQKEREGHLQNNSLQTHNFSASTYQALSSLVMCCFNRSTLMV